MCSFWNTKELEYQTVGSKVLASGSELMRFALFSGYLHRFKSNSNLWIVVGKGIQWSLQWRWSQPVLTAGSKLRFLGSSKVNFGSNLVKVDEKLQMARFDVKAWEMFFWSGSDEFWHSVNHGLIRGILVNLT